MGEIVEFKKPKPKPKGNNNKAMNQTVDNGSEGLGWNNHLYILIGIPCSGKSSYAQELLLKKPDIVVIATDEIRRELTGTYEFASESNKMVFDIAKKMIQEG